MWIYMEVAPKHTAQSKANYRTVTLMQLSSQKKICKLLADYEKSKSKG